MAVLIRVVVSICLLSLASGCRSGQEQWGPFRGQIVDEETGKPIAGANVMVLWIREPPSLHFSQWFYDAQETVTDADGRFEIPRTTHLMTAWVEEPGFSAFFPGYLMQQPQITPSNGRPYVDPTVVRMRPLKTRQDQCKYEPGLSVFVSRNVIPRFAEAVDKYVDTLHCAEVRRPS